jgi:16S rRNA (cytidine1402-2'-O)-methyltransferase
MNIAPQMISNISDIWKQRLAEFEETIILYESPHRLLKFIEEVILYMGADRQMSVSREISKKFEETIRGTAEELKNHFENNPIKGEFVVCLAGKSKKSKKTDDDEE